MMKTKIEPYRVKVVEPIRMTTVEERRQLLSKSGYNLFKLNSDDVIIDLLTDSGTSAMSATQWSAIMQADESYAGASSFTRFAAAARKLFGFQHILPVHQGRAAERIFFETLVSPGDIVPNNAHFDTTRANVERRGATALDLPADDTVDGDGKNFKGNINLQRLENLLQQDHQKVPFGMLTLTNNSCAGQPVAMSNVIETAKLLGRFGKKLYIDAARCVENAYLIRLRDNRFAHADVGLIVRTIMLHAAGCLMSAKKDGIANIGGLIALNDAELFERLKLNAIVTEGYPTYGGLSGRDLDAIAIGLQEVTSVDYLDIRWSTASQLADNLVKNGIPVVTPPAMHAVYLNASEFLPHLSAQELPGQALACELYIEAGIRSCEIGTVMFGARDGAKELVRLALPRRVYSGAHYQYVAEAITNVFARRSQINGMEIVEHADAPLRHFVARFAISADKQKSKQSRTVKPEAIKACPASPR